MKLHGFSDYGNNISAAHPFYLRCKHLNRRSMEYLKNKNSHWERLSAIFVYILFFNVLILFWLSRMHAPIIYVDTFLSSGHIYEKGLLDSKPLTKSDSKKKLSEYKKLNKNEKAMNFREINNG